jgi:tetratricopeptide (TPR) repeat protein
MLRLTAALAACAIASPAFAQTPQIDRHATAQRLLDALKSAPTESTAALVEAHVEELWASDGTPAVRLLLSRGMREMKAGANQDAIEDFGAAIVLQPDLPDPWQARAQAKYAAGDAPGAVADLSEAVKREPRDFAAYRMLADIAASRQDWKTAFAAWQRLVAIDPKTPGADARLKELRRKALGEST